MIYILKYTLNGQSWARATSRDKMYLMRLALMESGKWDGYAVIDANGNVRYASGQAVQ